MKSTKKWGTVPQKGGKFFCFPPKLICVLDAKFNVDYDFAIKHDLILWSDQFVGIHSLHQKRGHNSKKGGNFLLPTNFLCVLDAKFNVDYDFAIKHDLIPWSDQLMGIHSLHQKGGHNSSKKGGIFLFPTNFFMCIRCKIWCRLWFCHQTWPNFMIWLTYGC